MALRHVLVRLNKAAASVCLVGGAIACVVAAVFGHTTIMVITSSVGIGGFAMYGFACLAWRPIDSDQDLEAQRRAKGVWTRLPFYFLAGLIACTALLVAHFYRQRALREEWLAEQEVSVTQRGQAVVDAIHLHKKIHGEYPKALGVLFGKRPELKNSMGVLHADHDGEVLTWRAGERWKYIVGELAPRDGFRLVCYKPWAKYPGASAEYEFGNGKGRWRILLRAKNKK